MQSCCDGVGNGNPATSRSFKLIVTMIWEIRAAGATVHQSDGLIFDDPEPSWQRFSIRQLIDMHHVKRRCRWRQPCLQPKEPSESVPRAAPYPVALRGLTATSVSGRAGYSGNIVRT